MLQRVQLHLITVQVLQLHVPGGGQHDDHASAVLAAQLIDGGRLGTAPLVSSLAPCLAWALQQWIDS